MSDEKINRIQRCVQILHPGVFPLTLSYSLVSLTPIQRMYPGREFERTPGDEFSSDLRCRPITDYHFTHMRDADVCLSISSSGITRVQIALN